MTDIIVAFIGFAGIIIAQIIQSSKQTSKLEERLTNHKTVIESKIEALEEKVDLKIDNLASDVQAHNKVIERTYQLETKVAVLEQKVS